MRVSAPTSRYSLIFFLSSLSSFGVGVGLAGKGVTVGVLGTASVAVDLTSVGGLAGGAASGMGVGVLLNCVKLPPQLIKMAVLKMKRLWVDFLN